MTPAPLPSRPERWLRAILGDTPTVSTIIGDLREEYGLRPAGPARTVAYTTACAAIAIRYVPPLLVDILRIDVRHAKRSLLRSRTYAMASALTLALGIGIAATLLSITYGSLIRPLPYPDPDALVRWGQTPRTGPAAGSVNSAAVANLIDLSRDLSQFTGLAAFQLRQASLTGSAGAERVLTAAVTGNFFDVLGTRPLIGRALGPADDSAGVEPTVVIAERLWRRQFFASPDIVGQVVRLDTVPHRVIGVMPDGFPWPGDPQAWLPVRWTAEQAAVRRSRQIEGLARLKPGVSLEAGTEELRTRFAALASAHPAENDTTTIGTMSLRDWMLDRSGPNSSLLPLLAGLAAVMLSVAYLNLATLAIGRREARQLEIALRHVLGASNWRQALSRWSEAAMVAAVGAVGGGLLAAWAIPMVITRYGSTIARAETITADLTTTGLVVLAAAAGAVVMAIATRHRSGASGSAVGDLNRRATTGPGRLRRRLVAVQVGLAGGLVYGALLISGMIAAMSRVDLGVPLDDAVTFAVGIPTEQYDSPQRVSAFFRNLEEDLLALPGVTSVGATSRTPFFGGTNGEVVNADEPDRRVPITEWRTVTPGFFATMGLQVLEGGVGVRAASVDRSVAISAQLSEGLFGSGNAVGRRVQVGARPSYTVSAVVADIRDFGPTRPSRPTIYFRHGSETGFASSSDLVVVVRTAVPPHSLTRAIRERVAAIDADVPIRAVATLEELATRALGANRTTASTVLVTMAGLALLLGMIGVFGVAAVNVEQRTREIGVRLALGDTPGGILRLILSDGMRLTFAGAVLAAGAAWYVHRLVESSLVAEYQPHRLIIALTVAVVLVSSALIACFLPARKAARLSPTEALRAE